MDLVSSCKDKLAYFRIKELKDVLTQLGLSKQGKKQDLVDRILSILSDERVSGMWAKKNAVGKEEVAKLVDDTYRKMQVSGAPELASKGTGVLDGSNVKLKGENEDSCHMDKIRCPCGNSLPDSMIECEDTRCHVWQHISCVIIPEKPMEGVQPIPPDTFYCELCRLKRADPFWVTVAHPLLPVKLSVTAAQTDGTNPVQSVEKTFQLTRVDKDLLSKEEYEIQAWCMLLNDKVQFRMHWPQFAELQVNGSAIRAVNRPGSQLLGPNGRDDGPMITQCTRDGINKISLTGCDARVFCLGVRIVKRRTIQQMSGSRMKVAGRFKPCAHMGCFDLEVFVEMNQRSRKWQCPICLKNYSLESIIIDPYFNRITSKMLNCGEDVREIEVKPDGSWRAKADGDRMGLGDLGQWHNPDSTIAIPMDGEPRSEPEVFKQIKQECASEGYTGLKLGIKKNRNGFWEVSKAPEDLQTLSSGNRDLVQNVIPMSSSATGSGRDGEDPSVNQDGGGNFDFAANNGTELESLSLSIDPTYGFTNANPSPPLGDAEVIVLSDSGDENVPFTPGTVYKSSHADASGMPFSIPSHAIANSFAEDPSLPSLGIGVNSCPGLFNPPTEDEFGIPLWPLNTGNQGAPSFQFFGSEADVSDALVDVQHGSMSCPTPMNAYTLTAETAMGSAALVPQSSVDRSNSDINDGLVDNPLAFGGDDPSLQIFLPTRPSDLTVQSDPRDQPDVSNGTRTEDWISLRLGGAGSGGHGDSTDGAAAADRSNSRQHLPSKEGALDSLANTASLLLGMDESGSIKSSRERSDSPFCFPRQRRSVRPRLYLSIDSDSDE